MLIIINFMIIKIMKMNKRYKPTSSTSYSSGNNFFKENDLNNKLINSNNIRNNLYDGFTNKYQ